MPDDRRLIAFALGTFHAFLLTFLLVVGLYLTSDLGKLLDGFSTAGGLAVFAALWTTSVYCTYRGLRDAGLAPGAIAPAEKVLGKGFVWGAWNGMLFFWCLLIAGVIALTVLALADNEAQQVFGIFIFGLLAFAVGSVFAAIIGGATGILLALLDLQLLRAACTYVGAENH